MSLQKHQHWLASSNPPRSDGIDCSDASVLIDVKTNVQGEERISRDSKEPGLQIKAYKGQASTTSKRHVAKHTAGDAVVAIVLWLASNICIVLLNKFVLGTFGFGFPIFLTECHMLACALLSMAGYHIGLIQPVPMLSLHHLTKIIILAGAFLLSVVLNNVALRFIPVSFVEEIGAVTPAATAALAFLVMGTSEKRETYAALIPVMLGIVMATGYELSFNSVGFTAAVGGCLARALKTVLQAVLLSGEGEGMDSMNLLRLMAPIAALMLVPAIALLEPGVLGVAIKLAYSQPAFGLILLANSGLAYIVNYTNFRLTKVTSPLTLQVLGCAKGVLATFISLVLFGNRISGLGALGYGITVSGVLGYGLSKHRTLLTRSPDNAS